MSKVLIYDLDLEQLVAQLNIWGEPPYRAKQVWEGLYLQLWSKPEEFTNLSKPLRQKLQQCFSFSSLNEVERFFSTDQKTTKVLFRLLDGPPIETVLMRYAERRTVCISTQAGCALGCVFCATGQMGFRRNLSSGEIVEQVLVFARQLNDEAERPTNVVLMGMGEPFHNYDATMAAIDRLGHPDGFNMGARRFTISTVGLIPAIKRFTAEKRQIGLAISLHASEDALRTSMLPINRRYPIKQLIEACREYVDATGRRITFEWALIQGVNDSVEEARNLALLLKGLICHVNVIPLNPTSGYSGARSTRQRVSAFRQILETQGISCTVRVRRGIDIHAGCGQLAGQAEAAFSAA
ncbi:MAG TPA: 23S rRNA (adenine(2503)-C(2))-methyltransferase RlmN, partial [Anaerolineales bacterium]|nr:23S rRNA (adenine(2503)-C(2))-methyltransferase RlmN [Anaerolineales bacterium]